MVHTDASPIVITELISTRARNAGRGRSCRGRCGGRGLRQDGGADGGVGGGFRRCLDLADVAAGFIDANLALLVAVVVALHALVDVYNVPQSKLIELSLIRFKKESSVGVQQLESDNFNELSNRKKKENRFSDSRCIVTQ